MQAKYSVLFVCLGNICRSPTAHAVFRQKSAQAQLNIHIDSAGTQGFHRNAPPDGRAILAGEARGYDFSGLSARKVTIDDFNDFDLILAMDQANFDDLIARSPLQHQHKIKLLLSFTDSEHQEVPDPYYGGTKGFDVVLDLIEQGCDGLLQQVKDQCR